MAAPELSTSRVVREPAAASMTPGDAAACVAHGPHTDPVSGAILQATHDESITDEVGRSPLHSLGAAARTRGDTRVSGAQNGAAADAAGCETPLRGKRRGFSRVKGDRVRVADFEAEDGGRLRGLRRLLDVCASSILTVTKSQPFSATFSWGARGRRQWVRASEKLYGAECWDNIIYRTGDGEEHHHGRAALIVKAVDEVPRDLVIVQRLRPAVPRRACVLSMFGCKRLRCAVGKKSSFPSLGAVNVKDMVRLEHVVPDFEEHCEIH